MVRSCCQLPRIGHAPSLDDNLPMAWGYSWGYKRIRLVHMPRIVNPALAMFSEWKRNPLCTNRALSMLALRRSHPRITARRVCPPERGTQSRALSTSSEQIESRDAGFQRPRSDLHAQKARRTICGSQPKRSSATRRAGTHLPTK